MIKSIRTRKRAGAICFIVIAAYMAMFLMFAYQLQVNSGTGKLALGREEALENITLGPNKFSEELERLWSEIQDWDKLPVDVQFFLSQVKKLEIKSYKQSLENAEYMLNDIYNNMVIVKCESDTLAQKSLIAAGFSSFFIMVIMSVVLVRGIKPDTDRKQKNQDEWEKSLE